MSGDIINRHMVFLFRKAGNDIKLIRRTINQGWYLYALTEDKAWFFRPETKEVSNARPTR